MHITFEFRAKGEQHPSVETTSYGLLGKMGLTDYPPTFKFSAVSINGHWYTPASADEVAMIEKSWTSMGDRPN